MVKGTQKLFYDGEDLYYLNHSQKRSIHRVSYVRIVRVEQVKSHFLYWEVKCNYIGFIDKPIDDVNLDMELELKKLKNIKRKKVESLLLSVNI